MEYHFHKHKGRRRRGRDHLIEILQCCSDDQEQQTGTAADEAGRCCGRASPSLRPTGYISPGAAEYTLGFGCCIFK